MEVDIEACIQKLQDTLACFKQASHLPTGPHFARQAHEASKLAKKVEEGADRIRKQLVKAIKIAVPYGAPPESYRERVMAIVEAVKQKTGFCARLFANRHGCNLFDALQRAGMLAVALDIASEA